MLPLNMAHEPLRPPAGFELLVTVYPDIRETGGLWRDSLLRLSVNGNPAGRLVMSYVPGEVLKERHPLGIVDYVRNIRGHGSLDVERSELPNALRRHLGLPYDASPRRVKSWLDRNYGDDYRRFLGFHVDKPFVAGVRIHDEKENFTSNAPDMENATERADIGYSYRNLGLAPLMYQQAALWLHARGFRLYADDVQKSDARRLWKRLQGIFPDAVGSETITYPDGDRTRFLLDGSLIGDVYIPERAGELTVVYEQGVCSEPTAKIYGF